MKMPDTRICDTCLMEYDWPGVDVGGYSYCCEPCSRGEECICWQHNHDYQRQGPSGEPVRQAER
jgi:hypothetical protein